MATLVVREPGCVAYSVELSDGFGVGRDPENELALGDRQASRRHARFTAAGDGYRIADLGSTHGTLVNGVRAAEHQLVDGDEIQVGNVLLRYRAHGDPAVHTMTGVEPIAGDRDARRLQLLFDVSRAIGSLADPDQLLGHMLETALDLLECQRGLVGLTDGVARGGRRITRGRAVDDVVVSRSMLESVINRRESVLVEDVATAPPTMIRQGARSAIGAPLASARGVIGYLYVDDRGRARPLDRADLGFLTALAQLSACALEQSEQHRLALDRAAALRDDSPLAELIGRSEPMLQLGAQIRKYARAPAAPVLIHGDSGTGKELVARTLHALSARAGEPFIAVNCAAIPETMIESELFGHEKGAFTGALKARRGKFALAHRGTLFLDEIGDLSLAAQAKVLRALQEGEIQPLGSEQVTKVDVRVLAATHKDLHEEIAARRFREDLFFRLAVGELEVPPLRLRGDDVLLLAEAFLAQAGARMGRENLSFGREAVAALRRYPWPGNVRQLMNEVERAVILADGPVVELPGLRRDAREPLPRSLAERFAELDVLERDLVQEAMTAAGGNVSDAARRLGISRVMMKRRLDRLQPAAEDDDAEPGEGVAALAEGWQRLQGERAQQETSERQLIAAALEAAGGVVSRAARALGMPRTTLIGRIQALGLGD